MKTNALRIYGAHDLRVEEFELPPLKDNEIAVKIVCDSLCMSSYKAAKMGPTHKRIPDDVATNPVILGHEYCGVIVEVGKQLKDRYLKGQKFTIQPSLEGTYNATGYSFQYMGGNTQFGIVPSAYFEGDNVLIYDGDAFFHGALAEAYSCVIGAAHASFHTVPGTHIHKNEIVAGGKMALLAGAGPMGLAFIDYILHRDVAKEHKPSLLVVTDIDDARLGRAAQLLSVADAEKEGVRLVYLNTIKTDDPVNAMRRLAGDGKGFDDVFVFAPVKSVIEQADELLAYDGCINFFAGPTDTDFSANLNFYKVKNNSTHIAGTSGGNTSDLKEALALAAMDRINPAILVTHIGGLDAAVDAILHLPELPGGKKVIYNHISMPMTAIDEFAEIGKTDPLAAKLSELCEKNDGLWNSEAESYLLEHAKPFVNNRFTH
jgi:threonine dehydrogenase-like Zn-dependent dehydrogenase